MEKHLNFMGDTQDYKFHPRLANPYGLRGNPDTQANCPDQGDGLNGTPEFENFTGEESRNRWFNQASDDASSGDGSDSGSTDGPNWWQRTFGSGEGEASSWWSRNFGQDREPLSETQKANRTQNWASALQGLNKGFQTGLGAFNVGKTGGGSYGPQYQSQPITTTQTNNPQQAGMGSGKVIGYVLIGAVVIGGIIFAVSAAGKSRPASGPSGNMNY